MRFRTALRALPRLSLVIGLAVAGSVLVAIALVDASPPEIDPVDLEIDGPGGNVDDPCFWVDPVDPTATLLFVTAKDSGLVEAWNLASGTLVGTIPGFARPNNCAVEGDLLLTTDSLLGEVQVHHLPDLTPVATFGQDLVNAEGIDVLTTPEGRRLVYVTDSSDASVHVYELDTGVLVRSFPTGFGLAIEPVLADDRYQRIFVSREEKSTAARGIGLFTPDGTFQGEFGANVFSKDPEGLAIYACGDGGYLIAADQLSTATQFEVFDRVTLEHIGTFRVQDGTGEFTNSTDGIDIVQTPLPGYPNGALAACDGCGSSLPDEMDVVSWDRIASVMGFDLCPDGAAPDCVTTPCVERILATADAGVSSATPNANLGADLALKVDASPTDQVLVRFTMPDLTGYQVLAADVRLTVDSASGSPSVAGGKLFRAEGVWDEGTVTFATRPSPVGEPVAVATAVEEAQAVDFDVRSVLQGPGTYDFILTSDSSDGARYRSREAGQSPPVLILRLKATNPPEVRIASPADGAVLAPATPFDLAAVATDADEGDLSSAVVWRSDRAGQLGSGSPLRAPGLAAGPHTITAEVANREGLSARASVRVRVESAPAVTIAKPDAGAALPAGVPVVLMGNAQDAEDGDLSPALTWSSDLDGALGRGASLSVTLSEGTHRLHARVTDTQGNVAGTEVTVVVAPAAPVVRIEAPANGTTVATGTAVTLTGGATDPVEGDLGALIAWRSSLQGTLGAGPSVVAGGLQIGTHVITATVTNGHGLTGQATITLRVAPATLSIEAAADTCVDADAPDTNLGAETTFVADGTPARIGLLRFVVSGSAGLMIERAVVRLTVSGASNSESASGGTLHALTDTGWQERSVTYRTRPPIDGLALDTRGPVAKGEVVEFDVTSAIPGDGAVTFALDTTGGDAVRYRSREGAAGRPTLVITLGSRIDLLPGVSITAPADGTTVDHATPLTFSATATDPEDGDLRRAIVWTSDRAGTLGSGPVITVVLAEGTHVVSASVTDSGGRASARNVTVTVRPPAPANTPPRLTIDAPADGRTFTLPDAAVFAGSALDDQEGNLGARLRWTSDRDGLLATGMGFTRTLSEGTHRITASVTDAGGLSASATVSVVVVAPTTLEFAPVADTYVDEASPNTNFGNNPQLRIDSDTTRTALLRFTVSGVGTRSVLAAELRLQVDTLAGSDGPDGGTLYAIAPTPWQERTVNWVTRPPTDRQALARVGAVEFAQVVDLDVSAAIRGDGTYELALIGTSPNAVNYRAREAASGQPRLILTLGGYAPEVSITSPADQTVVFTSKPIMLTGSALDVEDGEVTGALRWSSDRDGLFGTGAAVSSALLGIGTHVVTAAVTDSGGRSGQAQITLRVRASDVGPTVTIAAPSPDTMVAAGTLVGLAAGASDVDGTDISGRIQWASSRDGALGAGAQRTAHLSEGSHTLTAMARDDDGAVGSSEVTLVVLPTPPIVTVTAPADGTTVLAGAGLIFRGSASDATDGDLSQVLLWTSDRDGQIGLGQTFSTARLSVGTHRITAAVADSGDLVGEEARTVVILPNDRPPVVAMLAPADGSVLLSGQPIVLSATATDAEDGNLGTHVQWTSSLDGPLGTGDTLVVSRLSAGTHALTASVDDSSNHTASAGVSVTLSSPVRTFPVVTDTYVDAGAPAQSFGNATELLVDASPARQAFLRFSVTGIAPFAVGQARVRLTAASNNGAPSESGGTLRSLTDSAWSGTATWNTRPTIDGPVLASQGEVVINQAVDFDVTSSVGGDGTFNFALSTVSSDGVHYRSRESTMGRPQLIVTRRQETAPVVSISSPLSGARVPRGMLVAFTARAIDAEDGDLTDAIAWSSSRDGVLGTGGSLTLSQLSVGRHVVTAAVSDRSFRQGTAIIDVTVTPGEVGFGDFAYGPDVDVDLDKATAQKPESKLWHHDGSWWATLFRPEENAYRIHRLEAATGTWIDTGTPVDERARSRQDVLWDGQHLYITSRFGDLAPQNRLLRYHYDHASRLFVLDPAFPVDLPGGGTEALTIAKDSHRTLWITYTLNGQVFVSRTTGADETWAKPALLPVAEGTTVSSDDVSGVVALEGKIGIFWSNQLTETFYFAVHDDGAPPSEWHLEIVARGPKLADDHFNLKLAADGRLFAAVKTSQTTLGAVHIGLLVRSQTGVWSNLQPVAGAEATPTRPLCVLDEAARRVYVFFSNSQSAIYYKTSDMDSIAFPDGSGTPFIASDGSGNINNPTGTKQSVDPSTGIVVVASGSERYWHGTIGVP